MHWQKAAPVDFEDFLKLLRRKIPSRRLSAIIATLHANRKYSRTLATSEADGPLSDLLAAAGFGEMQVLSLLAERNRPPAATESIASDKIIWALMSLVIFEVDPILPLKFSADLVNRCLTEPTNVAF